MKKAIIAISDLHIGSYEGMIPRDGFQLDNGAVQQPSRFQEYLLEWRDHFWGEWVPQATKGIALKNTTLVLNGDVVDGNHHQAVNLIPNVVMQEQAAVEILKPITKKYRSFMVRGTEAHGGKSDQNTESVARQLGCELDESGMQSVWQLWLDVDGVVFQFAHHISTTSSAAYETSAPMRELVAGLVESAQWDQRLPDVFVRSHRHRYNAVSIPRSGDRDIQLVITPAWQLRTPFVEKIDRMRLPHIGGVVFIVEDGICQVKKKIYNMPKPDLIQI
ncbi:MAG TPA: hypothetical protein DDY37_07955 [Legionella sp.]|nr:hypothetical protein [Legionella sp.]